MHQHRLNSRAASIAADAVCRLLDGGYLCLYGDDQPVSADSVIQSQPHLVTLTFSDKAFRPAVAGEAKANPITRGLGKANGRATWFRAFAADDTPVFDGSVGLVNANLVLDDVDIQVDAEVSVASFLYKQDTLC